MSKFEYLILRLIKTLNRPTTFNEMVNAIGIEHYLPVHIALNHLVQLNWITQTPDTANDLIFIHWPTLEGLCQLQQNKQFQNLQFAHPIQKGFE